MQGGHGVVPRGGKRNKCLINQYTECSLAVQPHLVNYSGSTEHDTMIVTVHGLLQYSSISPANLLMSPLDPDDGIVSHLPYLLSRNIFSFPAVMSSVDLQVDFSTPWAEQKTEQYVGQVFPICPNNEIY